MYGGANGEDGYWQLDMLTLGSSKVENSDLECWVESKNLKAQENDFRGWKS